MTTATQIAACGHPFDAHSDELHGRYCRECDRWCSDACRLGDPVFTELVGTRFVELLKETLTPEEFETVRTLNDARTPGICHSHDFVDANVYMDQAWVDVLGRHAKPSSEADAKLWGEAWDWAIDHGLSHA